MMIYKLKTATPAFLLLFSQCLFSSTIVLNFKPVEIKAPKKTDLKEKSTKSSILNNLMAVYGGLYKFVGKTKQLIFPKKHASKEIKVLLAPKVEPVKSYQKTIATLKVPEKHRTDSLLYSFTKEPHGEKEEKWTIFKLPIPKDGLLKRDTVVIETDKPSLFYIPEEEFFSQKSEHFMLPTIFYINDVTDKKSRSKALTSFKLTRHLEKLKGKAKKHENGKGASKIQIPGG